MKSIIFLVLFFLSIPLKAETNCGTISREQMRLLNEWPNVSDVLVFEYGTKTANDQDKSDNAKPKSDVKNVSWEQAELMIRKGLILEISQNPKSMDLVSISGHIYHVDNAPEKKVMSIIKEVDPCLNWIRYLIY